MITEPVYDNPAHWKEMHLRYPGSLKAVGRSGLSETYNRYKYRSEEETFSAAVAHIIHELKNEKKALDILDIGAGTGYWLDVVNGVAASCGLELKPVAIDLSERALEALKLRRPETECLVINAGTADPSMLLSKYDLVMANYCLHHITDTAQFKNALQLAINSVAPGGCMLLMDCLIDKSYSPYYLVDAEGFTGSGLSRPLKWIDEAAGNKKMKLIYMADPVSYLMNNVLESESASGFRAKSIVWKVLEKFYRSELYSRLLMPLVYPFDRFLKKRNMGCSTRLVIYQKQTS